MPLEAPHARLLLLALACSFLALTACSSDKKPCETDRDCQGDQVCTANVCTLPNGQTPAKLGQACGTSGDCLQGLSCRTDAFGFPGGVCTASCEGSACAAGSSCADLRSSQPHDEVCLATCKAPTDCRSGWGCCQAYGGVCMPTGLCPDDGVAASTTLGSSCLSDTNCSAGEECLTGPDFPGGLCTRPCAEATKKGCPDSARCAESPVGAVCLATCTGVCRTGYSCSSDLATDFVCTPSSRVARTCTPPGTPQLIAGGQVGPASAPTGCLRPDAVSALPFGQVQKLGQHRVNDVVSFTVPANAGSVSIVSQMVSAPDTIVYQGTTLPNTVVPTFVHTPDGHLIFDDSVALAANLSTESVYYGTSSPGTGVMTIPNTTSALNTLASGGALPSGTWNFTVNDYANECVNTANCTGGTSESTYDLSVLIKPAIPAASATVDVAFYLVGVTGMTSQSALTDAHVARMLKTLGALFGNFGLCLGTVTFYDVPAWAKTAYATSINADKDGPCDALNQMFTLAQSANTLNFFLVEDISSTSAGGQVVGIDGTIPGPSSLGGTIHSGAAVSASDLASGSCGLNTNFSACGADRVAYIAAHEGGHWMGMYHTSEATGDSFDSLGDTDTCTCNTCVPSNQQSACGAATPALVTPAECTKSSACGGGDNLMFWQLDPSYSTGKVSAQQGRVARANVVAQ